MTTSGLDIKAEAPGNLLISRSSWKLFVNLIRLLNKWGCQGVSEGLLVEFMRQHGSLVSSYLLLFQTLFSGGHYELAWQVIR